MGSFRQRFLYLSLIGFVFAVPLRAGAIDFQNSLTTDAIWAGLQREGSRPWENHWGDDLFDGLNIQTALHSHIDLGDHLSLVLTPVLTAHKEDQDLFFRQGYFRLVLFNVALKVGRDSLWWGPGRHGALLVSNNAFPFDLIEVESAAPFHLPAWFSRLGTFEVQAFLTRLEEHRDYPHVRLFGLHLTYHPIEAITVGFSRVTMFGGEGRPGLTLVDFVGRYFSKPNEAGKFEVNELAGFDVRIRPTISNILPGHNVELYFEYGGEDEARFRPTKPAFLGGLDWVYQNWRTIIEYANNHVGGFANVWYNHTLYTSGYTYRGNIIGHHMGSDANDIYIRTELPFRERWIGGIDFELERRHLSSPVQERMRRWGGDVTYFSGTEVSYSARLMSERISHLNLLSVNEGNVYGVVMVTWKF